MPGLLILVGVLVNVCLIWWCVAQLLDAPGSIPGQANLLVFFFSSPEMRGPSLKKTLSNGGERLVGGLTRL